MIRVCAFKGWKYKYILEYDPRNLGAWIIQLRRELLRHL